MTFVQPVCLSVTHLGHLCDDGRVGSDLLTQLHRLSDDFGSGEHLRDEADLQSENVTLGKHDVHLLFQCDY